MDDCNNNPLDFTIFTTNMVVDEPNPEPQYHSLSNIEPCCVCLPGIAWGYHKTENSTMVFCELISASDSEGLRIRKHVEINLTNGICTSYVMQHMVSGTEALEKIDIERCIEDLHMLNVCVGGPSASKFVPVVGTNCYVDAIGNWRHNSCKIVTDLTGLLCSACKPQQYLLTELECANSENSLHQSNDTRGKRALISNFCHRRQKQIQALRKRCSVWYRKKRRAEKEMRIMKDMIDEMSEEPEQRNFNMEDDNDDNEYIYVKRSKERVVARRKHRPASYGKKKGAEKETKIIIEDMLGEISEEPEKRNLHMEDVDDDVNE